MVNLRPCGAPVDPDVGEECTYGREMAPSSFRRATGSSRRELTPSLTNTLCRWYSTVRELRKS
jgi:hypothetical protein